MKVSATVENAVPSRYQPDDDSRRHGERRQ